jgi:epoxyqueuosine reductase
MNCKQIILETATEIGFQRTVIANLEPMEMEKTVFQAWLDQGYAADMNYLKRDPNLRISPQLLFPQALSAIVVFASYYTEAPEDPGKGFGRVARYAVGMDYHTVLKNKLYQFKEVLEKRLGRPILGKAFSDAVPLYEQGLAKKSGLGFAGKNTLIIGPKLMGSYYFIAELLTDLDIASDAKYEGTCGDCFRCGINCPTNAILDGKKVDSRKCISYLTIENRGAIPIEFRSKIGSWVYGCDVCQEVCPYNQKPAKAIWPEFQPASGVGHYLDLLELISMDESTYRAKFKPTALTRAKQFGLKRNALVVLGNQCPENALNPLIEFAKNENDPILKEHAIWAIAQYQNKLAKNALDKLLLSANYATID